MDNLKRHQACIDLRQNVLRIGTEVTPFLAEADIPGHAEHLRSSVEGLPTGPSPPPASAPPPLNTQAAPRPATQTESAPGEAEAKIQLLISATGVSRQQAVEALRQCGGNADMAAQTLMGGF